jgi:hypothetical protein
VRLPDSLGEPFDYTSWLSFGCDRITVEQRVGVGDRMSIASVFSWAPLPDPATFALIAIGMLWLFVIGVAARRRTGGDE